MESHDYQLHSVPGLTSSYKAPASLLAETMARIEPLEPYLDQSFDLQECLSALQDPRWEIRAVALHALNKHAASPQVPAAFIQALHDEHTAVRVAAVQALGSLDTRVPLDQLILALQDPEWEVREMVVLVLQRLQLPAAQPLLQFALYDTHRAVRDMAGEALAGYASPEIDKARLALATPEVLSSQQRHVWQRIKHSWLVMRGQIGIIQKNWSIAAIILGLSYALMLLICLPLDQSKTHSGTVLLLAFMSMLASIISTAFTTDLRRDVGLELALATPTSIRILLLGRFSVIVVANIVLASIASLGVALFYHQNLWEIMQFWLGPVLLVSTLTLILALLIGAGLSLLNMLVLAITQCIHISSIHVLHLLLQTNLLILLLATLCLSMACIYAPHWSRRAQQLQEL